MKNLLVLSSVLFSVNALACMPTELENESLGSIDEKFTELPKAGLKISSLVRKEVNKITDISGCKDEDVSVSTFLTNSGKLFHAVYTSEDYCDGGNSYGAVLDANLRGVALIGDSDFYCMD